WLMQKYLVDPLALDGAYFGVPSVELVNVARLIPKAQKHIAEQVAQPKKAKKKSKISFSDKLIELSGQNPQDFLDAMVPKSMREFSFFSDEGLQAVIPAANGVFTAKSLAKIYAMLANKGVWEGQVLIKPEVFAELSKIQNIKRDRV